MFNKEPIFSLPLLVPWGLFGLSGILYAQQELIPPFVIHGETRTEVFRLSAKGPILDSTIKGRFRWRHSNDGWQIESTNVNSLIPDQTAVEDCMSVPGGVRSYTTFLGSTNRGLDTVSVCPITFPPPGRIQLLFPWLCLCPDAKLPLLDERRMRRFPSILGCQIELLDTDKNEGRYSIKYLGDERKFISALTLTNNGIVLDWDMDAKGDTVPAVRPFPGVFERGFRELAVEVTASTNVNGISFPLTASYVVFGPDYYTKPLGNVFTQLVSRLEIRSIELAPTSLLIGTIAKRMIAFDQRPDNLPKNRTVNYVVSNEQWRAITEPHLVALANIARKQKDGTSQKETRYAYVRVILAILFLSPLVWLPFLLRACLKTLGNRRVRARGLQDLAEKPVACRPGALTGRVFKHALRKQQQQGKIDEKNH